MGNNRTTIKIFDVEKDDEQQIQAILPGHADLIHDIDWSPEGNYLVSASADTSAIIWNLNKLDAANSEMLNYAVNDKLFFL